MSFGQRFIYVGVGGSGQSIGRELEGMLRRQICGPDGGKARGPQGRLPELRPYQLPRFIQTVYVDVSESDLASTKVSLHPDPSVVDETATFVHALPKFSSSNQITNQLRTTLNHETNQWLPPRTGDWGTEPTFAPLAVGAGQYPTIGRAALFAMLEDLGPEGLFRQFDISLSRITSSLGDLKRYNPNGQVGKKVIVLIGGSLSGGTGGGIFYDIVQLFVHRAVERLGFAPTVIPLITLPRAFDGVLSASKRRSSRLNAARGIADIGHFIDLQNAPPANTQLPISYPKGLKISIPSGTVKSAFLFDTPVDMKTGGVERSIARFALDLVSDVEASKMPGVDSNATRYMPLLDKLVNDTGLLQLRHPTYVGNRPLAMAAAVEIPDEMNSVARLIAEDLFKDYVKSLTPIQANLEADDIVRTRFSEEVSLLAPESLGLTRQLNSVCDATSTNMLNRALSDYIKDAKAYLDPKEGQAGGARLGTNDAVARLGTDSKAIGAIARVVAQATDKPIPAVLFGIQGGLKQVESKAGLPHNASPEKLPWPTFNALIQRRWPKPTLVPKRGLRDKFNKFEKLQSDEAWRNFIKSDEGGKIRGAAANALNRTGELIGELTRHVDAFDKEREKMIPSLQGAAMLNSAAADAKDFYVSVSEGARKVLAHSFSEAVIDTVQIAARVITVSQNDAMLRWQQQDNGSIDRLANRLVEGIQTQVLNVLQTNADVYMRLEILLNKADVKAASLSQEDVAVSRLRAMILNKVNTSLVPPVLSPEAETRLAVSFPGADTDKKKEWLKDVLKDNPSLVSFLDGMTIVPNSAAESIGVSLSVVGLGVLDVPDAALAMNTWIEASHSPKGTDRLAWRQRLGYRDAIDFVSHPDRITMLRQLLVAAYNGRLTAHEAADDPSQLGATRELQLRFGAAQADPFVIPLVGALPDRFAQLPDAFLEAITLAYASGKGREVGQILDELMELRPDGSKSGRIPAYAPTPLFVDLAKGSPVWKKEVDLIEQRLATSKKGAAQVLRSEEERDLETLRSLALKEFLGFWTEDIPAALDKPFGLVGFNTLNEIIEYLGGEEHKAEIKKRS
jgi:hypothetical protein